MAAPYNNVRSKNDRAWVAFLISQGVGDATLIFPKNTRANSAYPNVTVKTPIEEPVIPMTGNRKSRVMFMVKGSASQDVSVTDEDKPRKDFDTLCAKVNDAIMQTDDNQTLQWTADAVTAAARAKAAADALTPVPGPDVDLADYTCLAVYDAGSGDGDPDEEGCSWVEVLLMDVVYCGSNVS